MTLRETDYNNFALSFGLPEGPPGYDDREVARLSILSYRGRLRRARKENRFRNLNQALLADEQSTVAERAAPVVLSLEEDRAEANKPAILSRNELEVLMYALRYLSDTGVAELTRSNTSQLTPLGLDDERIDLVVKAEQMIGTIQGALGVSEMIDIPIQSGV